MTEVQINVLRDDIGQKIIMRTMQGVAVGTLFFVDNGKAYLNNVDFMYNTDFGILGLPAHVKVDMLTIGLTWIHYWQKFSTNSQPVLSDASTSTAIAFWK